MIVFQQVLFFVVLAVAAWIFFRRVSRIRKNILLGRETNRRDQPAQRWKTMLLFAFGQRKMFKKIIPAVLHFFVYAGFLLINIEVLEFIIDGLAGRHRTFARLFQSLGWTPFYTVALNVFEFLAVAVLVSCLIFLVRRNILKVKRFDGEEMTHWPKLDANLILIFEIILMVAILTMNAADQILQTRDVAGYPNTGPLVFSKFFAVPIYHDLSTPALTIMERLAWWIHIVGIFGFAIYVTYSKHLHILLAFPNTWYANLEPKGKMQNMPEVTNEVRNMLGIQGEQASKEATAEIPRLGAKDVHDLTWKNLMDAYACTECGRCTAVCPANMTGKKLSPRKIMMDTRDRLDEVGQQNAKQTKETTDGHTLLGDYISKEEIFACTACNACVEACPVLIDPLSIILQLRRYLAMEESSAPAQWNAMFSNIETNFSPWKFAPSDRFNWAREMTSENPKEHDNDEGQ